MSSRDKSDEIITSLFSHLRDATHMYDFDILQCPKCPEHLEALELDVYQENGETFQRIWWACRGVKNKTCFFPLWVPPDVFWTKRTEEQMKSGYIPLPNIHLLPRELQYLYPKIFTKQSKKPAGNEGRFGAMSPSSGLATRASSVRPETAMSNYNVSMDEISQGLFTDIKPPEAEVLHDEEDSGGAIRFVRIGAEDDEWPNECDNKSPQAHLHMPQNLTIKRKRLSPSDDSREANKAYECGVNSVVAETVDEVCRLVSGQLSTSDVAIATIESLKKGKELLGKDCSNMTLREYLKNVRKLRDNSKPKKSLISARSSSVEQRTTKNARKQPSNKRRKIDEYSPESVAVTKLDEENIAAVERALMESVDYSRHSDGTLKPRVFTLKGTATKFRPEMIQNHEFDPADWRKPVKLGGSNLEAFLTAYNLRYNRSEYLETLGVELFKHKIMNFVPSIPVKQQRLVRRMKALQEGKPESFNIEELRKAVNPSALRLQIAHRLGIKGIEDSASQSDLRKQSEKADKLESSTLHDVASAPVFESQAMSFVDEPSFSHELALITESMVSEGSFSQSVAQAVDHQRPASDDDRSTSYIAPFKDPEVDALVHRKLKHYVDDQSTSHSVLDEEINAVEMQMMDSHAYERVETVFTEYDFDGSYYDGFLEEPYDRNSVL